MSPIKLEPYEQELVVYSKDIIAYLKASGVPDQLARDISQDVFLKMLESNIILPPEKIRAWMYRVAVRKYIDHYRRDKTYLEILQRDFSIKKRLSNLNNLTIPLCTRPLVPYQKSTAWFYRFIILMACR